MDPIEAYIRQAATQRGIDPDVAVQVAKSEGINYTGDQGSSFGPYQLHYGGVAPGGNAVPGLGDQFTAQTGLHASDPSTIQSQIDFALDNAAQNGWGAWHAWKGDPYAGIPRGGRMATSAPPTAPMTDAEAAQFLQSRETAKTAPASSMSDQEAAKFLEQREAATANPPAAPIPPAPAGSVPTPPQVGTGQTYETPAQNAAELARGQQATSGPSITQPVTAAIGATANTAEAGAQRFNKALPDWMAGNTASAVGDVGMGVMGVLGSPLAGVKEGVAQVTGSPDIGESAANIAGLVVPVPKVLSAVNEARPSVQGLNELIKNIPPEDIGPGLARLEANPSLSPADVFPSIRQQVQGLGVTQGPWQGFLDQVAKQRGQDAFNSVTNATNTLGVSDTAYNTLNAIMQRARDTGQKVIQPVLDNTPPIQTADILSALDKRIGNVQGQPDIAQSRLMRLRDQIETNSGPTIDADAVHGVQSRLREDASTLLKSTGSDRLAGGDLMAARGDLVNLIDKASPSVSEQMPSAQTILTVNGNTKTFNQYGEVKPVTGSDLQNASGQIQPGGGNSYRAALSQYRDDMQVREAFDKGLGVSKTRQGEAGILEDSPQAWQEWAKTVSPDEMDAARAGALADLQRRVAQASKPVSEQTAGAPIPQINQNERARFDTLFGADKTNQFIQKLRDEKDRASLNQILFGGSQTAQRQVASESVAAPPTRGTSGGTNPNLTALLSGAAAEGFGHMVGAPTGSLMLPVAAATRVIPPIYNRAMTAVDMARWRARNNVMAQHALAEGDEREPLMSLLQQRAQSGGTGNKLTDLLSSPVVSALPH